MSDDPYRLLAGRLDSLPNGFPAAPDGVELRLLAYLYSPEEARLAAQLHRLAETSEQIAARLGADPRALREQLKSMSRRGLIAAERLEDGLGFRLMPFVVGIYEMQIDRIDAEFARLFEAYYKEAFQGILGVKPSVHRLIPVGESVRVEMSIQPYESVTAILDGAQAWGVLDCICRKQKALIGEACRHPIDVCMALSHKPGAFDGSQTVRALTRQEAQDVLRRAAQAGLVHSVSNSQDDLEYICNCCTCSCGVLRGIAELGIANAVARSAFLNQVDGELCTGCELCADACQFDALSMDGVAHVDELHCLGCGVCVPVCPDGALGLVRRPVGQVEAPPVSGMEWLEQRALNRGMDLRATL